MFCIIKKEFLKEIYFSIIKLIPLNISKISLNDPTNLKFSIIKIQIGRKNIVLKNAQLLKLYS